VAAARTVPGFAASASFRDAAARVVAVRTEEVFEHAEHVLDTTDIERVHDMRVATRRLRAALEIFATCFPKSDHRKVLKEVKRLADALGERRDPDVAIHGFERVRDSLPASDRSGVNHLIEGLRERQAGGNEVLADAIERVRREGLHERLLALSAQGQPA
jgi:CHAD domain-containing protein